MTDAAAAATIRGLSGTARGQIEFSLNLLRIASPGEPVSEPASDLGSARITALEELLAMVTLGGVTLPAHVDGVTSDGAS